MFDPLLELLSQSPGFQLFVSGRVSGPLQDLGSKFHLFRARFRVMFGCQALPQSCPRTPDIPERATHLQTPPLKSALFRSRARPGDGKSLSASEV